MKNLLEKRLEQYTLKNPSQVLLVTIKNHDIEEQIVVFKGFSSSLTSSTAYDPEEPVFPQDAEIIAIDIVRSPYNPDNPQYLTQNLTKTDMETMLVAQGI